MNQLLWTPAPERAAASQMARFSDHIASKYAIDIADYDALHRWSVENRELFWAELWELFGVVHSTPCTSVLRNDTMPGADWFSGSRLNFAENLLRYRDERIALVSLLEDGQRRTLSYAQLYAQVSQLAASMRARGITSGDRVAGFLPNIAETVVAMLATTSIGAIWSSCSPDFGINGVMDRFGQIEPRLLFTADGYFYNGKRVDSLQRASDIAKRITSIESVIVIPVLNPQPDLGEFGSAALFADSLDERATPLEFAQLPFDHPLYIMYSSGTTGVPKCIVHGAGGTLLQHLKEHRLHTDIDRDDVFFYFTTCGWMMWNWLVSGLATGCTVVLYDGSPFTRDGSRLIDAIDEEGITVFGVGAKYIAALEKAGIKPRESHRLDSLNSVLSTGSPLSHDSFEYVYRDIKADVSLASISGGTDIISTFVLGNPLLPVYSGEIQCRGLGMAVEIWDDQGRDVVGAKGELVCTKAFPCSPIMFWNDGDGSKFRAAYFELYPGTWAQGDYGEITEHGGIIIHGRSDAVLNPGGVRIGTAEVYRQVEKVEQVLDSVVIGQQWRDDVRVVLFVVLRPGIVLDDTLSQTIRSTIKAGTTPRHVPAKIIQVDDIPRTISGKIVELAVRNMVHGDPVKNRDALANPQALDLFSNLEELQQE
jgi:acetoacetyl-CoA synthetase